MNSADRDILPLLAGWLDGELTPEEKQRVEAALARSADLRTALAEWRSVDAAMPQGEPVRAEVEWETLAMRVEATIADEVENNVATATKQAPTARQRVGADRRWTAWLGSNRWAMGGGSAFVVAAIALLIWTMPSEVLRDVGVVDEETAQKADLKQRLSKEKVNTAPPAAAAPEVPAMGTAQPSPAETRERKDSDKSAPKKLETPSFERTLGLPRESPHSEAPLPDAIDILARALVEKESDVTRNSATVQSFSMADRSRAKPTNQRLAQQLDTAIAARDRSALQRVVADLNRHHAEAPDDSTNVTALGLAVRARAEFLRLFPDATENQDACVNIRSRYDNWQKLADPTLLESWEGLQMHHLVNDVCPE